MNKLRKLGEALWYNKERIVLGVMVCILLWHVYGIFNPKEEAEPQQFRSPSGENIQGAVAKLVAATDPPEERPVGQWEGIYTPNPFWALSAQASTASRTSSSSSDNISLINIQRGPGGKWRAQLKTPSVTKWYDEGESFESFRLMKIDPQSNSVEVHSERSGKTLKLVAQGN